MSARGADREARRNEAFATLFDANWAPVRHHIECVVDDDAEVTEIVSEVFLTAWTRMNPARPPGRVWLLRVADRRLEARAARVTTRRTALDAVHQGVSGRGSQPEESDRARVLRALASLAGRERRIIMLTYWDGLSAGEIAELMRSSRPRVRRTLRRAQERLRSALDLEGTVGGDD